ncbi:hypothetical protein [Chryseobacterium indoltheticum]|uniref:PGAP1-like protein n=1 Tax=Chryseobacterium indoltheticum TaxID=254 RepID=A0A381F8E3_9FLAO|nr:hypothetical protein [Chryseobacterium indoltheticum]AZA73168.1 hypothetical protein EG358_05020 [Chryseobacterium indoltheticum]SIP95851.1 hypothetical protein SAMN05421682_101478 [Chryseobacterium indoltheticum]SUX42849.1 PGAP1-like protein [Chryseobacterium indoltheticum]
MKINIWKVFSVLFFILINHLNAQKLIKKYEIDSLTYLHKSFQIKKNTINFLEIENDTSTKKKDLIIFLQGSNPSPLISEDDNGKFLLMPFNLKEFCNDNIFIIIAKPKISLYKHFQDLDDNFQEDNEKILFDYMRLNTLQNLTQEVNIIIKKYSYDKRINNIYVIGHSQGGRVAMNINKKKIKKIAVLSVNLLGRFEESITNLRYEEISKQDSLISNKVEKEYVSYKRLKNNNDFKNTYNDLSLESYKSFTFPSTFNQIKKNKTSTLIAYGTNDIGVCFTNDLMRLELLARNKKNYYFKTYSLLDHNFNKLNLKTKSKDNYWQKVLEDTIVWLKKT